jgi:hypothetical protein
MITVSWPGEAVNPENGRSPLISMLSIRRSISASLGISSATISSGQSGKAASRMASPREKLTTNPV